MPAASTLPPSANSSRSSTLALEEARRQGASQCEADASLSQGLSVERAPAARSTRSSTSATAAWGSRSISASARARPAPRTLRRGGARHGREGLRHRPLHGRGPLRGAGRPEALARDIPGSRPRSSLGADTPSAPSRWRANARRRDWTSMRASTTPRAPRSTASATAACYGNSLGFLAGYSGTSHSVSCSLLAQDGEDMQRDYWYTTARDPAELEDAECRSAAPPGSARWRARGAQAHDAQGAGALLAGYGARPAIGHFIGAIRGTSQYRKASFLLNAAGKQVFPGASQHAGAAAHPQGPWRALRSTTRASATRDRELVADGVLTGYMLGSYSARRLGLKTTGNAGGVHNLLVEHRGGRTHGQGAAAAPAAPGCSSPSSWARASTA